MDKTRSKSLINEYLTEISRDVYLYGSCNVFAVAVKEFLNGRIVCLLEHRLITSGSNSSVNEGLIHCFVKVSETHGFDARGFRPIESILEEYINFCDLDFPFWVSEEKTDREVLDYGYQNTGGNEVIDIANARNYILENLYEEIESVRNSSKNL